MTSIIQQLENEQLKPEIPEFSPGDTVRVQVKVKEGTRERLQAFEGVVIAIKNRGLNSSFTVRKMSYGEGVERVFQTHSPLVADIEVRRRGDVRRAKLYYLRGRTGKSARIRKKSLKRLICPSTFAVDGPHLGSVPIRTVVRGPTINVSHNAPAIHQVIRSDFADHCDFAPFIVRVH